MGKVQRGIPGAFSTFLNLKPSFKRFDMEAATKKHQHRRKNITWQKDTRFHHIRTYVFARRVHICVYVNIQQLLLLLFFFN